MKKQTLLCCILSGLLAVACQENASNGGAQCNNNQIEKGELCDGNATHGKSCADFDSSKTWEEGGKPGCATDCKSLTQGSCTEKGAVKLCGDGKIDTAAGEVCDGELDHGKGCTDFDDKKTWEEGGKPGCATDCKSLTQGSCTEKGAPVSCGNGHIDTAAGEVCDPNKPQACPNKPTSNIGCLYGCLIQDLRPCKGDTTLPVPSCQNGKVELGENCDFGQHRSIPCQKINANYTGGDARCTNHCQVLDLSLCEGEDIESSCGNGSWEPGERCDYGEKASLACQHLDAKFSSGFAKCLHCKFVDISDCQPQAEAECNNGIIEAGEKCDFGGAKSLPCQDIDPTSTNGQAYCSDCKELNLLDCEMQLI